VRVLLDTCTFLWAITGSDDLSPHATSIFEESGNEVLLSSVSVWEICLKYGLGRLTFAEPPDRLIPHQRELHGIDTLALEDRAVLHLPKLPSLHRDPFDRMLICQAIEHECVLLTPDSLITQYPVRTVW